MLEKPTCRWDITGKKEMKKSICTIIIIFCTALTFQMQAQDIILPKQGDPISAYNLEISNNYYFYTLDENAESPVLRIAKDSVLMIRKADGSVLSGDKTVSSKKTNTNYPIIKDEDIHGSLIAEGNKVFIPTNSDLPYERAGQERLKEQVEEWGYWTVVNDLEQAHFVLQFVTSTQGLDASFMIIRPRKYYREKPIIKENVQNLIYNFKRPIGIVVNAVSPSNEEISSNKRASELMFKQLYRALSDPSSSEFNQFHANNHLKEVLEADAKTNNYHSMVYTLVFPQWIRL